MIFIYEKRIEVFDGLEIDLLKITEIFGIDEVIDTAAEPDIEGRIGAFSLKYCGEAASATSMASYKETVDCQAARLSTLANDYNSDSFDYSSTPNYSKELQDKVVEAVGKAQEAETPTLEMVTSLGDLMQEVYDCKQAYAVMLSKAEIVLDLYSNMHGGGLLTEEEETYAEVRREIKEGLEEGTDAIPSHPVLFDISIWYDDQEIEPAEGSEVLVEVKFVGNSIKGMRAVLMADLEGVTTADLYKYHTPAGIAAALSSHVEGTGFEEEMQTILRAGISMVTSCHM